MIHNFQFSGSEVSINPHCRATTSVLIVQIETQPDDCASGWVIKGDQCVLHTSIAFGPQEEQVCSSLPELKKFCAMLRQSGHSIDLVVR